MSSCIEHWLTFDYFAGAVFALGYGDRLGRRRMMYIASIIMLVGVLIQVTSFFPHKAGGA